MKPAILLGFGENQVNGLLGLELFLVEIDLVVLLQLLEEIGGRDLAVRVGGHLLETGRHVGVARLDLLRFGDAEEDVGEAHLTGRIGLGIGEDLVAVLLDVVRGQTRVLGTLREILQVEIGRASCRERV